MESRQSSSQREKNKQDGENDLKLNYRLLQNILPPNYIIILPVLAKIVISNVLLIFNVILFIFLYSLDQY